MNESAQFNLENSHLFRDQVRNRKDLLINVGELSLFHIIEHLQVFKAPDQHWVLVLRDDKLNVQWGEVDAYLVKHQIKVHSGCILWPLRTIQSLLLVLRIGFLTN